MCPNDIQGDILKPGERPSAIITLLDSGVIPFCYDYILVHHTSNLCVFLKAATHKYPPRRVIYSLNIS